MTKELVLAFSNKSSCKIIFGSVSDDRSVKLENRNH